VPRPASRAQLRGDGAGLGSGPPATAKVAFGEREFKPGAFGMRGRLPVYNPVNHRDATRRLWGVRLCELLT
jgi:hypothetical protein